MHVRGAVNTTSAIVCELPADPDLPARAWVALGSACASVFVPVFPPDLVTAELSDEKVWRRFAALRDRVEADGEALARVREVLAPLEAELWEEADGAASDPAERRAFVSGAWVRVERALDRLD
jgi:hypothetical protein